MAQQQQLMPGSSSCSSYGAAATTRKCPTGTRHHPQCSSTADKEPGNENRHVPLESDSTSGFDLQTTSGTDFDDDLLFFTSLYANSRARSHSAEESFCLSPDASNILSSPTTPFSTSMSGSSGKDIIGHPSKVTKRQAQNREAQRRFRERREQERTHLLELLQKLGAENERISSLLDQAREKYLTLEARTKQLQTEADILRRWRQEMMCSMTGLIQHQDLAEEVLEAVAGSCSYDCWRKGIQRSRAFIVLQTLAGLFAGVEDGVLGNSMGSIAGTGGVGGAGGEVVPMGVGSTQEGVGVHNQC